MPISTSAGTGNLLPDYEELADAVGNVKVLLKRQPKLATAESSPVLKLVNFSGGVREASAALDAARQVASVLEGSQSAVTLR